MDTEQTHCSKSAEFDGRLWDVARLLRTGDVERARVESALLLADAESAGFDWVAEQLLDLWAAQEPSRRSA
ncbi:MAG: hypothetical protein H6526_08575 [Actinobacteria bacterium]|mgnify:CR=1 FL=1|nr:hypothetical protein [Actinomycetota bacterium]MCB8997117.1 hypothetical protein [Actinomycetota bacterium]MCB9415326.1 hypothetical protein [Actinomycetota bacterium]MCB9424798.1 hypothetical protein [Actinomycetota bacterium]